MKSITQTEYRFLDTVPAVHDFVLTLGSSPAFAMDLEADSLYSYQEKVCLVQISTPSANVILDPLSAREGLQSLGPLLADTRIRKVFHGADYDIRLLKKDYGLKIHNIADTMIAAQLVGRSMVGLAALLSEEFGLELGKGHQKDDWAHRPLDQQQLRYAALDTAYLLELWQRLRTELQQLGRLEWAEEEFRLLEDVTPTPARDPAWFDVKGARDLLPRQRSILQNLVQLRDQAARAWDRPPFKVLSDQVLLSWAQEPPRRRDQVLRTPAANQGALRRLAPQVLEAVQRSTGTPLPDRPRGNAGRFTPLSGEQKERLARLKQLREQVALRLGLSPGLLVNSETLEKLCYIQPQEAVALLQTSLKRWQHQVLGVEFEAILLA